MKTCGKCGLALAADPSGRLRCKPCKNAYMKEYHRINYERDRERSREYLKKHADEHRRWSREYYWKTYKAVLDKRYNASGRSALHLQRKYGLTVDEHADLLRQQDGVCAICGTADWRGPHNVPVVDHDHESGEIRGLVCHKCNVGLGNFRDNVELLARAIVYLQQRPAVGGKILRLPQKASA